MGRISATVDMNQNHFAAGAKNSLSNSSSKHGNSAVGRGSSTSVAVSTSTSELKLLRVLQTLQSLCAEAPEDGSSKRNDSIVVVTGELVQLLDAMNLDNLW